MQSEVGKIAEVKTGHTFRAAINNDTNGNILIVQAKNITHNQQYVDMGSLVATSYEISADYMLRDGDILLVARGMKFGSFRAAIFRSDAKNVVASASLHVIRIKEDALSPEYLSQYLNSTYGQEQIAGIVSGSYIGAISRKNLEDLVIPIPDPHKQKAIVDLYRNMVQQQKNLDRQHTVKQKIINATFKHIIKERAL